MTTLQTRTHESRPRRRPTRRPASTGLVAILGGLALAAAPVLMTIGFFTSPPQDSTSNVDYVTSMARAPFQAALSANFLHYAWVVWALAALAMITLFRGRRGRVGGTITAVLAAVSSIQLSGMLLSDFYAVRVTQESGRRGGCGGGVRPRDLGRHLAVVVQGRRPAGAGVVLLPGLRAGDQLVARAAAAAQLAVLMSPLPAPVNAALMIIMWAPAYLVARQLITGRRRGHA